jgi:hypothetical protein
MLYRVLKYILESHYHAEVRRRQQELLRFPEYRIYFPPGQLPTFMPYHYLIAEYTWTPPTLLASAWHETLERQWALHSETITEGLQEFQRETERCMELQAQQPVSIQPSLFHSVDSEP